VSRKGAFFGPQVETLEGPGRAPRAELRAHQTLVQIHARELGETLVDGLGEREDALRDLAGGGDDDDHHQVRL